MALGVVQVHVEGTRPLTSCGFECILVARPARTQPDATVSAASLASLSFVGSTRGPKSPAIFSAKTSDHERGLPSRPGTDPSGSNSMTGFLAPQNAPLSPAVSIRRHQFKCLTPSSIPFFHSSSSQSIYFRNYIYIAMELLSINFY